MSTTEEFPEHLRLFHLTRNAMVLSWERVRGFSIGKFGTRRGAWGRRFWLKSSVMEIPAMVYHMTSPHPEGLGAH